MYAIHHESWLIWSVFPLCDIRDPQSRQRSSPCLPSGCWLSARHHPRCQAGSEEQGGNPRHKLLSTWAHTCRAHYVLALDKGRLTRITNKPPARSDCTQCKGLSLLHCLYCNLTFSSLLFSRYCVMDPEHVFLSAYPPCSLGFWGWRKWSLSMWKASAEWKPCPCQGTSYFTSRITSSCSGQL